jgi:hypothetical protein
MGASTSDLGGFGSNLGGSLSNRSGSEANLAAAVREHRTPEGVLDEAVCESIGSLWKMGTSLGETGASLRVLEGALFG